MKSIQIGAVDLPLDNFTISRTAMLGITKSGKTYGAKGIVEQLLDNNIPVVIFDAIGVWRWLRSPNPYSSKGKGYRVVVAGGSRPDIPLTPDSATEIVRAAIAENIPLVIDLYDPRLSKADWRRIVQKCCHVLLYENKHPRMIVIEEAAEYVPQTGRDIDGATFAAVEKIVRMGGNAQLGVMLLNQRAQEINKAVLELCDNIVLLRQRGRNAIDSLEKWMDRVATGSVAKDISKSLPALTAGECWVWTEDAEDPVRTRTNTIQSFHPDRTKPAPLTTQIKNVSTEDFVSRLTQSLEKLEVKTDGDSKSLKKLQDQLTKERAQLEAVQKQSEHYRQKFFQIKNALEDVFDSIRNIIDSVQEDPDIPPPNPTPRTVTAFQEQDFTGVGGGIAVTPKTSRSDLGKTLPIQILTVLAQHPQVTRERLAFFLGRHPNDKTLSNTLGSLRSSGYVDGLSLTETGRQHLGVWQPLPTGHALLDWYISHKLRPAETKLLRLIASRNDWTRTDLASALGKHPNDKGLMNNLGRLRTMKLVEGLQLAGILRE